MKSPSKTSEPSKSASTFKTYKNVNKLPAKQFQNTGFKHKYNPNYNKAPYYKDKPYNNYHSNDGQKRYNNNYFNSYKQDKFKRYNDGKYYKSNYYDN